MKWLWRTLVAFVTLPVFLTATVYTWLWSSLPTTSGELSVPGLAAPVDIIRDRHGIPAIFATSEPDAYFALGFVHAQDRLYQMEATRLVGQGRLSEVLGAASLPMDRYMRAMNVHAQAKASLAALSAEARRVVDAYTAGVNAWLATRRGALPIEFAIARHAPAPWEPADSLIWAQLMMLQLSGNWRDELLRLRLSTRLSIELLSELWPNWPEDAATTIRSLGSVYRQLDTDRLLAALPAAAAQGASNEWVTSGAHTRSGKPLLTNDPHLGLGAPGQWYLARLHAPGLDLAGAFAPGVPALVLGHNGHIAWGFTTTNADAFDLFIERLDPGDSNRYLTPDGPRPFERREERIRVKDGEDVVLSIRSTRHGVVISDVAPAAAQAAPANHVLALAYPGHFLADRTPEALFGLNRARDWAQFLAALEHWHMPMQNIVYADVAGNIGFVAPARLPIRRAGDGWLPRPGWDGAHDWIGFTAPADMPTLLNPTGGRIVNANNRIVADSYPVMISRDWDSPYRALRIAERLSQASRRGVADDVDILNDSVSLFAREILPSLRALDPADAFSREALAVLSAWEGEMRRDLAAPLIFTAWLREFYRLLLGGALGPELAEMFRHRPELVRRAFAGESGFCSAATAQPISCRGAATEALRRSLRDLAARHGDDMARWRWGDAHYAAFRHPVLSRVPVLNDLVAFRVPTDGDFFTINRGATALGDDAAPFAHVHGAGFKAVYDLADLGASRFMVAPGQSGNPFSAHFGDLAQPWSRGDMLTLGADRATLARDAAATLRLVPLR